MKALVVSILLSAAILNIFSDQLMAQGIEDRHFKQRPSFTYSDLGGIGYEKGVTRRDPSDVIMVNDLYYVWYTKITDDSELYPSGYAGTVWYAVSRDGYDWTEKGLAIGTGRSGSFDSFGVFTPNILYFGEQYFLYYTAVAEGFINEGYTYIAKTAIGVAVSGSPDGPWKKIDQNPVIIPGANPDKFDSFRTDDACLIVRQGKIWLYYKGRQMQKGWWETKMGVAVSGDPTGPFVKQNAGEYVQDSGHEVMVWPWQNGVMSLVSGTGPNGKTLQYASDGINFRVISGDEKLPALPAAPGAYRKSLKDPAYSDGIEWGICHGSIEGNTFLQRFEINFKTFDSEQIERPNIILIYADDLGRGLLSGEGQKIIKTPNIDRLAEEGIRFENAYGCMLCAPARASLLCGYHDCHGDRWKISSGGIYKGISEGIYSVDEIENKLNQQIGPEVPNEIFLAEIFKNAGYITGEIGKLEWGFATTDRQMKRHGWDYYFGYLDHVRCHGFYPPFLFENGQLVKIEGNTRVDCGKSIENETDKTFKERWNMEGKSTYSQNLFLDKILEFIRANKDKPFFLYHPTQLPHGPVAIPEVHEDFINDNRLTQIEKEYASMVKMLDDNVGIIMDELKKLGLDKKTMVIFTSDNGHEIYYTQDGRILKPVRNMKTNEVFNNADTKYYSDLAGDIFNGNDSMAGIKRSNWEGGVRVPLIFRWPGKIDSGKTSQHLVANYDMMATMADLIGVQIPSGKDGLSYLGELLGKNCKEHDYVIYSSFMGPAIVDNQGWKLRYFSPADVFQLYYLKDDYMEMYDILENNKEKAEQLKRILIKECNDDLNNGWFRNDISVLPGIKQ